MHYDDSFKHLPVPPEAAWRPTYWTPMKSTLTLGNKIADFMERHLTVPRAKKGHRRLVLDKDQRWLLQHMFEFKEDGTFRYNEIYLEIPRKQWKSMLASGILAYFLCHGKEGDQLFCAAKNKKQAKVVFGEARRNIIRSKALQLVVEAQTHVLKNKFKTVSLEPLSADSKGAFGLGPYISVGDEMFAWDSETGTSSQGQDMLTALTTGSGDRDEFMFIGITTAGSNVEGIAFNRREYGRSIAIGAKEDDSFGFFCWCAEETDDPHDEKTWYKANPGLVSGRTAIENFRRDYNSAVDLDFDEFMRFRLNMWIKKAAEEYYVQPGLWKAAAIPAPYSTEFREGERITVGFDGSLSEDSTGIVGLSLETGLMKLLYSWEKPLDDNDWFVDQAEVDIAMHEVFKDYKVEMVYCDASRYQEMVRSWIRSFGRPKVRDIPQSPQRLIPAGETFRSDLFTNKIFHAGTDKKLTSHTMNAVLTARGMPAKEKKHTSKKIDFMMAAIFSNEARHEVIQRDEKIQATQNRYIKK